MATTSVKKSASATQPWNRSRAFNIRMRPGEFVDLEAVAVEWECDAGMAAWLIIAEFLAACRDRSVASLPRAGAHRRMAELLIKAGVLEEGHDQQGN